MTDQYDLSETTYLEEADSDSGVISEDMFGVQGNYTREIEFVDDNLEYNEENVELLEELNASDLRYPGGSTTEQVFTDEIFFEVVGDNEANPWLRDGDEDKTVNGEERVFLDDLVELAAEIDASVTIVLPTRVAFTESAGQAMKNGSYGSRFEEIRDDYWTQLEKFVEDIVDQTGEYGVEIQTLEIGNEFWLKGEMSAAEYGYLAGQIAVRVQDWLEIAVADPDRNFDQGDLDAINIVFQGIASTTGSFSPKSPEKGGETRYIVTDDGSGDYEVANLSGEQSKMESEELEDTLDHGSYLIDISESGSYDPRNNSREQNALLAEQLISGANIAYEEVETTTELQHILDGVTSHAYFDNELPDIESELSLALDLDFELSTDLNNALGPGEDEFDLDLFITEWSARGGTAGESQDPYYSENPLRLAQANIEAFFELVIHGAVSANYWPLSVNWNSAEYRALLDAEQSFQGATFQLLSDALLDPDGNSLELSAVFDFDHDGTGPDTLGVDIHGFGNAEDSRLVLFVGDRAEAGDRTDVTVDLANFALSDDYFVVSTLLTQDAVTENALLEYTNGAVVNSNESAITFDLYELGTTRIELTAITNGADMIMGRGGDDMIEGRGGDDDLYSGGGSDILFGGEGNDTLNGGSGDDWIDGGNGTDRVTVSGHWNEYDFALGGELTLTGTDTDEGTDTLIGIEAVEFGAGGEAVFTESSADFHIEINESEALVAKIMFDTDDSAAWDERTITYDTDGSTKTDQVYHYDNGRVVDIDYDEAGNRASQLVTDVEDVTNFVTTETFYAADGTTKTQQILKQDNGNTVLRTFDTAGKQDYQVQTDSADNNAWHTIEKYYESDGDTVGRIITTYDDGRVVEQLLTSGNEVTGSDSADLIDQLFVGDPEGDTITNFGDTIVAGAGDDTIYDGAGDDFIFGGDGRDTFYGGAGADSYDGGSDKNDALSYIAASEGVTVDLSDVTNNTGIATGDTYTNIEKIEGSSHDDILIGDGTVFKLNGGEGDDLIVSGARANNLTGGSGADTFAFNTGSNSDTIKDFAIGEDLLDVSGWGVASLFELALDDSNGDVVVSFGDDSIKLNDIAFVAELTDADFVF